MSWASTLSAEGIRYCIDVTIDAIKEIKLPMVVRIKNSDRRNGVMRVVVGQQDMDAVDEDSVATTVRSFMNVRRP